MRIVCHAGAASWDLFRMSIHYFYFRATGREMCAGQLPNRLCEAIGGVPTLGEISLWGMRASRAASISKPKRSILYRVPALRQSFLDTPVLQPGMACP